MSLTKPKQKTIICGRAAKTIQSNLNAHTIGFGKAISSTEEI